MLKIVSGAVLDTANAHPNKVPDKKFARGVAKRAVGKISAQWAELLATETPVVSSSGKSHRAPRERDGEGRSQTTKAAPFSRMCQRLGKMVKPLRLSGDTEVAEAAIAAIKALAPLVRRERGKSADTPAGSGNGKMITPTRSSAA